MKKKINIAIDGPAAAGKSTIAKRIAERMDYIYIDTGAMYRAVTLHLIRHDRQILNQLEDLDIRFGAGGTTLYLNGEDVTEDIRTQEVTSNVSEVSSLSGVRRYLVSMQQKIAEDKGVVMDGRDIGTTVLPDAELKIFMKASPEIRAKRRLKEEEARGVDIDLETLTDQIVRRDELDMNREISPLVKADEAVLLDTSHMGIAEVEDTIIKMALDLLEGN
ncbi:(d)CMP kinase [Salinicoccus sesuvii]|uniref:Cytidylate kinase n=1 Tax=Salinicoccus sesuvii TaxID=868281 RepID=A0ABV7N4D8_9STAP